IYIFVLFSNNYFFNFWPIIFAFFFIFAGFFNFFYFISKNFWFFFKFIKMGAIANIHGVWGGFWFCHVFFCFCCGFVLWCAFFLFKTK
ncbi:hypothetical protein, partial [Salmonella enterica]|uniref:hypothetical protein n=1 Tax=Salmonella enterica TaxID=28901 RepID=UPI0020C2FBCA